VGGRNGGHYGGSLKMFDPRVYGLTPSELIKTLGSVGFGLACWLAGVGGIA
jgi:hypothetical protein